MQHLNISGIINYDDVPVKTKSGQHIDTDIYLVDRARLVQCNIRDITEHKQAEEALQESSEKYREIFESIIDVFYRTDNEGTLLIVSPSVERLWGYAPDEVIGKKLGDFYINPEERDQFLSVLREKGEVKGYEAFLRAKDGSVVYVSTNAQFYRDKQGNILGIQGMTRDFTGRKLMEEALRESEELFRSYLEYAPDGVYMSDLEGNFLYGNLKCEEIIGYRREELIGKNFLELNILPENSLNKAAQLLQANMEGKSTGPNEIDLISKEGRLIPVEINTNVVQRMGQRIVLSFVRDITERKRADEALRESESLSRSLIDYMHDAMIILDWDGSILFANLAAARIIEFERPEEFLGHNMIEYLHPDSLQKAAEDIEAVKAGKMGFLSEYQLCSVTGRRLWVESIGGKIIFRNASANLVCIRDITERKLAEEALRKSEEKYRGILENMNEAYFELDLNGNLIFFNEAMILKTGYSRGELMGMSYRQYISPETCKPVSKVFSELYKTGQSVSLFDYDVIMKGGQKRNYESWASLLFDRDNQPIGFRGMAHDITKRKMAEEELLRTLESLRKAVGATIQVMVLAVEARDPYTAGHQLRTADLARTIATDMGLPQGTIDAIRMAGSIHDIGKLYVPSEILTKPSKLTDIELSLIKEHSRRGYEMLKDVESPWPLAEIIYQHHERMNGSGYPRNLKGDDILMEARILAISDVVESMGSHRPYRPSLGIEAALEEIEKNRGTFYDTGAVDACLRVFREKGYQLQ
jgi:PAS domain S-box-containing protein